MPLAPGASSSGDSCLAVSTHSCSAGCSCGWTAAEEWAEHRVLQVAKRWLGVISEGWILQLKKRPRVDQDVLISASGRWQLLPRGGCARPRLLQERAGSGPVLSTGRAGGSGLLPTILPRRWSSALSELLSCTAELRQVPTALAQGHLFHVLIEAPLLGGFSGAVGKAGLVRSCAAARAGAERCLMQKLLCRGRWKMQRRRRAVTSPVSCLLLWGQVAPPSCAQKRSLKRGPCLRGCPQCQGSVHITNASRTVVLKPVCRAEAVLRVRLRREQPGFRLETVCVGSSSSCAGLSWDESKPRLTAEVKPHRAVPPARERWYLSSVAGCGCPCLPAGTHAWWFPPKTTS